MNETSWRPDRKVMAAAIATIALFILQAVILDLAIPIGIEAALVTVIAYLIPNPAA